MFGSTTAVTRRLVVPLAVLIAVAGCGAHPSSSSQPSPSSRSQASAQDGAGTRAPQDCAELGRWLDVPALGAPDPDDDVRGVRVETNHLGVRHSDVHCSWTEEFSDGGELAVELQATVRLGDRADMTPQELADAEQSDFTGATVTPRIYPDAARHALRTGFAYSHDDPDSSSPTMLLTAWTAKTALPIEFSAQCSEGACRLPPDLTPDRVIAAIERLAE